MLDVRVSPSLFGGLLKMLVCSGSNEMNLG
jgi:hypothetical protein